jgi:hypothetical protein
MCLNKRLPLRLPLWTIIQIPTTIIIIIITTTATVVVQDQMHPADKTFRTIFTTNEPTL